MVLPTGLAQTLPTWFRKKYQLDTGELIELFEVEEGLLIKPFKLASKKSAVKELLQILDEAGLKDGLCGMCLTAV